MELQPITPDSLDDEALTDLIEIRKSGVEHHANEGNKVQHALQSLTLIALVELQQRRDADRSDPIYQLINDDWYDTTKEIYESVVSAGGTGRIVYTAPQPAPVMNDELYKLANHVASSKNGLPEEWQDWAEELESEIRRAAMLQGGSSPVTQDGYVLVPKKLTAENGAKSVLSGEFSETKFINCPECFGDDDCETCDSSGRIEITVPVTWTTIKAIWTKGVEHFAAAPQHEVK